jgi:hypothetical protein
MHTVINTVGPSKTRNIEHSRLIDLEANRLLIYASKIAKVDKFFLVTSMFMTRPDSFVAFMLNTMVGRALHHK